MVSKTVKLLGEALLEPIHHELCSAGLKEQSKVMFLPAGVVAALPLISAQLKNNTSFEANWEVTLVPNLSMAARIQGETGDSRNLNCLVVSETESGDLAKLPLASREAKILREVIPKNLLKSVRGKQANLASVLGSLPEASVIHFASHGRYDSENPERSGIQLSGDHWLTVARLKSTAESMLNARLVFLSCCETGIVGKSSLPDEFVGLLPSLLQCGVRASIGALWPVCDDSAMLLSCRFYREYLDEDGSEKVHPAIALARAKTWLANVTIATLIDEGLISAREGLAFAESRFGCVRLRRFGESSGLSQEPDEACEDEESIKSSIGQLRIYSSPADWAAYVVVGV